MLDYQWVDSYWLPWSFAKNYPLRAQKTTMVQWRLRVFEEDVTTKPDVATGKEAADRKPRTNC
jgi:hypothetical protein